MIVPYKKLCLCCSFTGNPSILLFRYMILRTGLCSLLSNPAAILERCSKTVETGRRLLRVSVGVFFIIGAAGSFVMFMGAGWFSDLVRNPDARLAVQALSPALFLGCVMAAPYFRSPVVRPLPALLLQTAHKADNIGHRQH